MLPAKTMPMAPIKVKRDDGTSIGLRFDRGARWLRGRPRWRAPMSHQYQHRVDSGASLIEHYGRADFAPTRASRRRNSCLSTCLLSLIGLRAERDKPVPGHGVVGIAEHDGLQARLQCREPLPTLCSRHQGNRVVQHDDGPQLGTPILGITQRRPDGNNIRRRTAMGRRPQGIEPTLAGDRVDSVHAESLRGRQRRGNAPRPRAGTASAFKWARLPWERPDQLEASLQPLKLDLGDDDDDAAGEDTDEGEDE